MRFLAGLCLGAGIVGVLWCAEESLPLPTPDVARSDRIALCNSETRAIHAEHRTLRAEGDVAELWAQVARLDGENRTLRQQLAGCLRVEGERIPAPPPGELFPTTPAEKP